METPVESAAQSDKSVVLDKRAVKRQWNNALSGT